MHHPLITRYLKIQPKMTHREIAKALSISKSTVVNDLQSAAAKLHAYLTKGDPDPQPLPITRSNTRKKTK